MEFSSTTTMARIYLLAMIVLVPAVTKANHNIADFRATRVDEGISIHWKATSNLSFQYFEIERSIDGRLFESLSLIYPATTNKVTTAYSWVDQNPLLNRSYYRLKAVDLDGHIEYSAIIAFINKTPQRLLIEAFPSPSDGNFSIYLAGICQHPDAKIHITIHNLNGKKMFSEIFATTLLFDNRIHLNMENLLPPGTYIMVVNSDQSTSRTRLSITE